MEVANFGFMGLGVMGHMLSLNMERNGFHVAGYDLDVEKVNAFGTKYPGKNLRIVRDYARKMRPLRGS